VKRCAVPLALVIILVTILGFAGCATNTANLPQITCPDPLALPKMSAEQAAHLGGLPKDVQQILLERDILQAKRRAMLQEKCRLFAE